MKQFLMQRLTNKDLWAGFVIGVVVTVAVAYGLSAEVAQSMVEAILEIVWSVE